MSFYAGIAIKLCLKDCLLLKMLSLIFIQNKTKNPPDIVGVTVVKNVRNNSCS